MPGQSPGVCRVESRAHRILWGVTSRWQGCQEDSQCVKQENCKKQSRHIGRNPLQAKESVGWTPDLRSMRLSAKVNQERAQSNEAQSLTESKEELMTEAFGQLPCQDPPARSAVLTAVP